jgi:hypothetical protein
MKQSELKTLLQKAIKQQTEVYENLKNDLNPQTKHLADVTKGQKDALRDVLSAIEGNPVFLKMLGDRQG